MTCRIWNRKRGGILRRCFCISDSLICSLIALLYTCLRRRWSECLENGGMRCFIWCAAWPGTSSAPGFIKTILSRPAHRARFMAFMPHIYIWPCSAKISSTTRRSKSCLRLSESDLSTPSLFRISIFMPIWEAFSEAGGDGTDRAFIKEEPGDQLRKRGKAKCRRQR